jgi:hypothetical protein
MLGTILNIFIDIGVIVLIAKRGILNDITIIEG